jgi:hypothetical protein
MIGRGLVGMLRIGLVLVLVLAAAVAANIVLLGVANGPKDPVGRLSPRAGLVQVPAGSTTVTTPSPSPVPTRPSDEHTRDAHSDD